MSQAPNVDRVSNRRNRKSVGVPGQLDRYDDGGWEFFGNDETTAEQVAENIIRFENDKKNEEYRLVKGDVLAQLLLDSPDNKKLRDKVQGNPKAPIPKSMSFVAEAPTLKACVAMLMQHEKQLQQTLLQQDNRTATDKTLGTIPGGGLILPYEP